MGDLPLPRKTMAYLTNVLRSRGQGRDLTNLILDTKHVVESKMTKRFKTWRNSSYHIRGRALLPRRLMKNNHEWFCLQKGVRERCRKESPRPCTSASSHLPVTWQDHLHCFFKAKRLSTEAQSPDSLVSQPGKCPQTCLA